jgi:hypothetical protein
MFRGFPDRQTTCGGDRRGALCTGFTLVIMMGQPETLTCSRIESYHYTLLLCRCTNVAAPFSSYRKLYNYVEPKPFSWAKPACFVGLVGVFKSRVCTWGLGGTLEIVGTHSNSELGLRTFFLHKYPNYLGGESTNSGPMSTHGNVP